MSETSETVDTLAFSLIERAKTHSHLPREGSVPISYPEDDATKISQVEEQHFWFVARRQWVLTQLKRHCQPGARGIDIGCGSGFTSLWLSQHGFPTLGTDAHRIVYKSTPPHLGFLQGDIRAVTPQAEFDFLTLLDVVEHVADDEMFLRHCLKFLKPNGIAVITTPAFMWLWSDIDTMSGHFRRYTKTTMQKIIHPQSAQLLSQKYFYGSLLLPYLASRMMTRFKSAEKISQEERLLPPTVNKVFNGLLALENQFSFLGGLPLGTSLFTVIKKN